MLAEDMAHDVILRWFEGATNFDPGRPVWPYLRQIAQNLHVDRLRRAALEAVVAGEVQRDEPTVADHAGQVVDRQALEAAMAGLGNRHYLAIQLRLVQGWSAADAAEFLGITELAFRQLLLRARRRLQDLLACPTASGARVTGSKGPVRPPPGLAEIRGRTVTLDDLIRTTCWDASEGRSTKGDEMTSVAVVHSVPFVRNGIVSVLARHGFVVLDEDADPLDADVAVTDEVLVHPCQVLIRAWHSHDVLASWVAIGVRSCLDLTVDEDTLVFAVTTSHEGGLYFTGRYGPGLAVVAGNLRGPAATGMPGRRHRTLRVADGPTATTRCR